MKKTLVILISLMYVIGCKAQSTQDLIAQNSVLDTNKVILPAANSARVNQVVTRLLSRYHYLKPMLNDSISTVIFDDFLKGLDYSKLYFTKADVESFESHKTMIDDYLKLGELGPVYDIYNIYKERVNNRYEKNFALIDNGFDFTKDEYIIPNRKDEDWIGDEAELDDEWRKRIKNDFLNLKLSGKEEEKIKELLTNRYKNYHKAILQLNEEDVFQLYLNSFAETIDPHSSYFSPRTSENFNIQMKLSFEGIGARLQFRNDYTTITQIMPGGPAFINGELKKDDRISAVGQGEDGEVVDVVGWRIDDVVSLIRGEKGTTVKLIVLHAEEGLDAKADTILLQRDKVKLEEQSAKKKMLSLNVDGINYKLGVITLPGFYVDFEEKRKGNPDYKSTTRDVKKLLTELKDENVDGVIVDLRSNGGGSLQEAIDLTGLFIKDGPVVQVKNANGSIDVGEDENEEVFYDGPLGVMVNRFSASASEIFSGAIQDYGRGIIVGEQTYGKGTVQNLIDLNRIIPSNGSKLGQVKLTIAKYYRINGSSTQHLGVVPDVSFPSAFSAEEYGESSQPSAMKWDQINTTDYDSYGDLKSILPEIVRNHEARMEVEPELQYYLEDIAMMKEARAKKMFSLNEEKRKLDREERENKRKAREDARNANAEIKIDDSEVKTPNTKIDDPILWESGYILADMIKTSVVKAPQFGKLQKKEIK